MNRLSSSIALVFFIVALGSLLYACGDDESSTGAACEVVDDCFRDVDHEEIVGSVSCLDRVTGGYCTHTCNSDADCCQAEGECAEGINYVCAPLENSTQKHCFVTCEGEGDDYCHEHAHEEIGCRSTGGGDQNRKVCLP